MKHEPPKKPKPIRLTKYEAYERTRLRREAAGCGLCRFTGVLPSGGPCVCWRDR